jgi:hypothetical protein
MILVAHPPTRTRTRGRRLERDGDKGLKGRGREKERARDMSVDMIMGKVRRGEMMGRAGGGGGGRLVLMHMRRCLGISRRMGMRLEVVMLGVVQGRRLRGNAHVV